MCSSSISLIRRAYKRMEDEIANAISKTFSNKEVFEKNVYLDPFQQNLYNVYRLDNDENMALEKALSTAALYRYSIGSVMELTVYNLTEPVDYLDLLYGVTRNPILVHYKDCEILIDHHETVLKDSDIVAVCHPFVAFVAYEDGREECIFNTFNFGGVPVFSTDIEKVAANALLSLIG